MLTYSESFLLDFFEVEFFKQVLENLHFLEGVPNVSS